MSAVLMMPDSWQPTILRLVPFSSNNARVQEKKTMANSHSHVRNFPLLAVTRSSVNSDSRSDVAASYKSENDDASVFSEANLSVITSNTVRTAHTPANVRRQKYAKKKVPDTHSAMKEAIKFSVQDLNDQLSTTASLHSADDKDENKDKLNKSDYTRTKLPKPSLCHSPDARFCSPLNGIRRAVPLTPGEMELQRIRDSYYVEQVQKRKKYKLNVNQLPRSTTPINDHDPDKLNMKQVIAFLQTKTSQDIQKKILTDKRTNTSAGKGQENVKSRSTDISSSPKRVYAKDNVKPISRSNTEIAFNEKSTPDSTRLSTGCISVMSTKSSPNFLFGNKTSSKSEKATSTQSVRSFRDKTKERKSLKQKPIKEFKLFRFLAIAPDGPMAGLATTISDTVPMMAPPQSLPKTSESPKRIFQKRNNRDCDTAHVLRRHAVNRSHFTPPKVELTEENDDLHKAIKLPLVTDSDKPEQSSDSETCSTTSATCNSTKFSANTVDRNSLPKKGKSITFDENIDVTITIKSPQEHQNGFRDFIRSHKSPNFPKLNIAGPKQIHVSLPQEDKKTYSQEIVRLTLRQDKNSTRVTSYMSDIQQSPTSKWPEQHSDDTDEGISSMASSTNTHTYENRELQEHSKQFISTIANNNFIKVRQKLKASQMFNSE